MIELHPPSPFNYSFHSILFNFFIGLISKWICERILTDVQKQCVKHTVWFLNMMINATNWSHSARLTIFKFCGELYHVTPSTCVHNPIVSSSLVWEVEIGGWPPSSCCPPTPLFPVLLYPLPVAGEQCWQNWNAFLTSKDGHPAVLVPVFFSEEAWRREIQLEPPAVHRSPSVQGRNLPNTAFFISTLHFCGCFRFFFSPFFLQK